MGGPSCGDGPPLRVVLGAFAGPPPSQSSSSPATYILGTSYFATPRLGNSSSSDGGSRRSVLRLNKDGRVPMEDRKGPFDHFKPRSLVLSTVRTTAITVSQTISSFFSEQLTNEQRLDKMVESGELTTRDADEMNDQWENREWQLRMDGLPKKIGWAILRFHACTGTMRFYEFFVARCVLRVDGAGSGSAGTIHSRIGSGRPSYLSHEQSVSVMDKLTRDPFQASLRTSQLLRNQEHAPGKVTSSNGTETSTDRELAKRMFSTCVWANIIPFLAELTVQQGVLIYSYAINYMARQERLKRRRESGGNEDGGEGNEARQCDEDDVNESAYALSLLFSSSRLSIARSMGWIAASMGGAAGSVVYPGWGTVFGNQIGDAVVGALID